MKKIVVGILALLIIAVVASGCIGGENTPQSTTESTTPTDSNTFTLDKSKFHFYMYGLATCPHCKKMKEELPKFFGENSLTYYEIQGNEYNGKMFEQLYQILGVTGVPVIGIFYDGKLYAIVNGEFPVDYADDFVEEAKKAKGILFITDKVYLIPENNTEIINKLEYVFTNGEPSEV
ncbi:thioredoxin family protein [Thermococcus argininiproducens]|uniref:Thioredoxin family protein n=1 Tax=Thermococcus argininiproducens TaxID=2866384 RepID=A0A9E7SD39_9EURY|nr:thioredoxin family protein [Thermococcus argininiproducens]USH00400.1 thioredoxin family protein [Thermococcus argininiproducens]